MKTGGHKDMNKRALNGGCSTVKHFKVPCKIGRLTTTNRTTLGQADRAASTPAKCNV